VPPLHARFIGSIYAFGAVFLFACAISKQQTHVRWAILMTVIWTGLLGLISVFRLNAFDLSRLPDQIWFASYTVYPLIDLLLLWQQRLWEKPKAMKSVPVPFWIKRVLQVQGIFMMVVALLLLFLPAFMSTLWPWKVSPLLAQVYSKPLLAYSLGSLLFARETLYAIRTIVPAMLVFTAGTLYASVLHRGLFSFEMADLLWFSFFAFMTLGLLGICADSFRSRRAEDLPEKVFI
jgi:hypothetical protein